MPIERRGFAVDRVFCKSSIKSSRGPPTAGARNSKPNGAKASAEIGSSGIESVT
jgi:hypothetical protein